MNQPKLKPFPVPVSYFGITLGLFAIGLAWRHAQLLFPEISPLIADIILFVSGIVWLLLLGVYLAKWVIAANSAREELQHLVVCCFISLIPITTMLLGMALLHVIYPVALWLILLGTLGQLLFAAYRSAGLWRGIHKAEATTPVIYLPTVAANFVSAIGLSELGYVSWGMLFFGMAMLSWLTLEPAVLQRLRNLGALDEAIRPVIGIQLAPAFVAGNAYFHLNGGEVDTLSLVLLGYGLLQFVFLARLLPWIYAKGFTMGFWGFSFGLGSLANVGLYLTQMTNGQGIAELGLILFVLGNIGIALLLIGTLIRIAQGRFLLK
ncbi:dicarboxylate transporter/tellurite-resistance protein TehA [Pasteurellaceae bacterium USgator11]|nr:dicarboxylate transporter/tellurite-resistance protein TehA [Pasteurellaceae bacterium UScroc12]TNG94944.1 dicarboxylate transporter/tellurite-resistance protein TehA [Pasteurellaceae bacterium USgator41]TNH00681.1 dicarboxylate transporter/tellurite-resistance protein TehA [Pasteurellaceae bacterium UScroc31]TNH02073.1 dicarboxylate transporter/tellurite-resistance protein TehA [Pasteurellaceae bacterium USgator11]